MSSDLRTANSYICLSQPPGLRQHKDAALTGFQRILYQTHICPVPVKRSDNSTYLECTCPFLDNIPLSLELTLAYTGLEQDRVAQNRYFCIGDVKIGR